MLKKVALVFLLLNFYSANAEIVSSYHPKAYNRINPKRYNINRLNKGYDNYNLPRRYYYNQPKKSILRNISSYFIGEPTGFTPNIYDYSDYGLNSPIYMNTGYGNGRLHQYSNGIFGNNWSIQQQDIGNTSSIRILD